MRRGPNTSANNAEPGLVMANSAILLLGTDGQLSVYNQLGSVNVIIDVTGYFVPSGSTGTTHDHVDDEHDGGTGRGADLP